MALCSKELTVSVNKLKLAIMSRGSLKAEDKAVLLDSIKVVQVSAEKIAKSAVLDIY